jgi:hypothetical protein
MTENSEGFCERHGGPLESRLNPKAECCLQRIEASAQRLRETGDVQYIDRMHYDLFKARDSFVMESPDCPDEMEI